MRQIYLDEITGKVIEREETIEYDMPSTSSGIIGNGPASLPQFSQMIYNPARLDALSIKIINLY